MFKVIKFFKIKRSEKDTAKYCINAIFSDGNATPIYRTLVDNLIERAEKNISSNTVLTYKPLDGMSRLDGLEHINTLQQLTASRKLIVSKTDKLLMRLYQAKCCIGDKEAVRKLLTKLTNKYLNEKTYHDILFDAFGYTRAGVVLALKNSQATGSINEFLWLLETAIADELKSGDLIKKYNEFLVSFLQEVHNNVEEILYKRLDGSKSSSWAVKQTVKALDILEYRIRRDIMSEVNDVLESCTTA